VSQALTIHIEKACSKFVIAPLLAEMLMPHLVPISLFFGVDFTIAPAQ
jgi:hypothetical protein